MDSRPSDAALAKTTEGLILDKGHTHEVLVDCIKSRHSIRSFLPDPVPHDLLHSTLELAQLAPSNSNTQPWRIFFARDAARDRIVKALMAEAQEHGPNIPPLPEAYKHYRSEFGHQLYGPEGWNVPREDKEGKTKAELRNYDFFGAPVVGVICMPSVMANIDALGVGMYLQTLMLILTSRGLGTCVEVSVAGYPEVLRREIKEIGMEEEKMGVEKGKGLDILCGFAVGWPDWSQKVNSIVTARQSLKENIMFVDE